MRTTTRNAQIFVLHGHSMPNEYDDIFAKLQIVPAARRQLEYHGLIYAIPYCQKVEDGYYAQFVIADPNSQPIIFNSESGVANPARLSRNEAVGAITHMFVVPNKRRAAIEYVRRGPKALIIGRTIEHILRVNWPEYKDFKFEITAEVAKHFIKEINRFHRIRKAFITVTRPNIDWSDHESSISELMAASNAGKGTIIVTADRNDYLKKNDGIIKVIKQVVNDEHTYIKDAGITGTLEPGMPEKTLHVNKFIEQRPIHVQVGNDGNVVSDSVFQKLKSVLMSFL